jgi:hypothetical protein
MKNFTVDDLQKLWRAGPSPERDNLVDGIVRYVSKNADLSCSDDLLCLLSSFFTTEESVDLYEQIRDISDRLEDEWRDQFEEYFPQSAHVLPPPIA